MKRKFALVLAILLLTGLAATAGAQGAENMNKGAASFSLKLFEQALGNGDKNVVISPVSAYLALSLAAAGADGETLKEFAAVMGMDEDALLAYCAGLTEQLMQAQGSTTVLAANSGWIDDGFQIDAAYVKRITSEMQAEVFARDLDTDAAREAINAWVSERTNGLIPSLLDENMKEESVLALINTLYFKAKWRDAFEANDTHDWDFYREDKSTVSVPFMNDYRCDRD